MGRRKARILYMDQMKSWQVSNMGLRIHLYSQIFYMDVISKQPIESAITIDISQNMLVCNLFVNLFFAKQYLTLSLFLFTNKYYYRILYERKTQNRFFKGCRRSEEEERENHIL